MKITESYLRKIIRGAINETVSGADPTFSFHDSPQQQPSEMADKSSAEIAEHILSQYQLNSKVDANLLSLLNQISQKEEDEKSAASISSSGLDLSKLGMPMGENKKRR